MSRPLPPVLRTPDRPRRVTLDRLQRIGVPLLSAVPLLALLGAFGESRVRGDEAGAGLSVQVEYSSRYRYKQINTLRVQVENGTSHALDTVVVELDSAYAARFSTLMFIPSARAPFEMELLDLQPGEVAGVWVELQAERYGRHRGDLVVYASGLPDTVRISLSTFVFP